MQYANTFALFRSYKTKRRKLNLIFVTCISPLLIGTLLLGLEYFVILPYQDSRDLSLLKYSSEVDAAWSNAIQKGLRQFKKLQSESPIGWINDRVKVEGIVVRNEMAILTVRVRPRASLLFLLTQLYNRMNVDGITYTYESKYRVSIDNSGNVSEVLLLKESEIRHGHRKSDGPTPMSRPISGLILKEVKQPETSIANGKLTVTVPFVIENWGERRIVHPVIEYKVARRYGTQFTEQRIKSPDNWIINLEPDSIQPATFDMVFEDVDVVVLTKPPHKISVKLITISS